jgi:hypothetical protein
MIVKRCLVPQFDNACCFMVRVHPKSSSSLFSFVVLDTTLEKIVQIKHLIKSVDAF